MLIAHLASFKFLPNSIGPIRAANSMWQLSGYSSSKSPGWILLEDDQPTTITPTSSRHATCVSGGSQSRIPWRYGSTSGRPGIRSRMLVMLHASNRMSRRARRIVGIGERRRVFRRVEVVKGVGLALAVQAAVSSGSFLRQGVQGLIFEIFAGWAISISGIVCKLQTDLPDRSVGPCSRK